MPFAQRKNPDALQFGAIVTRLRMARGWERSKLAQRAGLSYQYIRMVEYGANMPTLSTALDIIEVLGGDVGDVVREVFAARNKNAPPSTSA